ncbi:MAG: glycosyltransferase family 2 protein [Bacteroidota bacterium]
MEIFLLVIEATLVTYFGAVSIYNFVFSLSGLLRRVKVAESEKTIDFKKFIVLIPAYKEDSVILSVAEEALNQSYPSQYYDVLVIADSLKKETLSRLNEIGVNIHEVSFEQSTKVKALNSAMHALPLTYDFAVVLDADNVMQRDFLVKANHFHSEGASAIQGRRAAKNKENSMAYLDGLSEEINNNIVCKGSTALGLSSALKGSGMSFHYEKFKELLGKMESVGGFDRELELRFITQGIKVRYVPDLVVYDEKIQKIEAFENQRKRWISSQFFYLKKYFTPGIKSLLKGKITFFNSSILRNIQLPRLLNLGLQGILSLLALLISTPLAIYWIVFTVIHYFGTLAAIPREYLSKKLIFAVLSLPKVFFKMFLLLFKLKGANKKFIHTPHGTN